AADRWRGISVGEFEHRQLLAIRAELNRAHAERVKPAVTPAATRVLRTLRKMIVTERRRRRRIWLQIDDRRVGRYLAIPPNAPMQPTPSAPPPRLSSSLGT